MMRMNNIEKYIWENAAGLSRPLILDDFSDYIENGYLYSMSKTCHRENTKVISLTDFLICLEKVNKIYLELYCNN
jgi:hypothetical protein